MKYAVLKFENELLGVRCNTEDGHCFDIEVEDRLLLRQAVHLGILYLELFDNGVKLVSSTEMDLNFEVPSLPSNSPEVTKFRDFVKELATVKEQNTEIPQQLIYNGKNNDWLSRKQKAITISGVRSSVGVEEGIRLEGDFDIVLVTPKLARIQINDCPSYPRGKVLYSATKNILEG